MAKEKVIIRESVERAYPESRRSQPASIIQRPRQVRMMARLRRRTLGDYLTDTAALLGLGIWALIVLIPLLVLIEVAVKSPQESFSNTISLPKHPTLLNFGVAWDQADLGTALYNSLLITVLSVIGVVIVGALAAYPLARRTGDRRFNIVYLYFVAGLIIPFQLVLIPLYGLMKDLGFLNSYHGIILLYIAGSLPFVIFLYTGFIKTVPREIEEAAFIDGAGKFRTFWTIIFPLLGPVTATVVITAGVGIWNEFFSALLFLQDSDYHTLPLAILAFVGQFGTSYEPIFATVVMASLPMIIMFFILQRYYIQGLANGALKG